MISFTEAVIAAFLTYGVMVAGYFLHRYRRWHIGIMGLVILFDVAMPFYLFMTRDWVTRLIDKGDILSFGLWTHFGLVITLYALYIVQVQTAVRLWRGDHGQRQTHRQQAQGILLVRGLVVITGAWLAEPMP